MTNGLDEPSLGTVPQVAAKGEGGAGGAVTSFVLECIEGSSVGQRFAIDGASPTRMSLGTSRACELRIADAAVSRRHAALSAGRDGLRVTDLDSTNGTFVGALRIYDATLSGGETLRVGSTVFRVDRKADLAGREARPRDAFGKMIGSSDEMRRLYPLLDRLARSDAPLLVEGEAGTGKELLAEAIHDEGPRRDGPFVVIDCSAVPSNLLEASLFGQDKAGGVFEHANGGTLFIDEVGDLDLPLQPKLLRAIQRSEVQRIGGARPVRVDVRVIAATRRDLDRDVAGGRFHDELFNRLNVARVELPPLRRRKGDVSALARHFWRAMGGDEARLSQALLVRFEDSSWPGNVRELYNAVARQLALGDLVDAPRPSTRAPSTTTAAGAGAGAGAGNGVTDDIADVLDLELGLLDARERVVRIFERRYLERLLGRHGGNVARAADSAGIARRHLHELLGRAQTDDR